MTVHATHVSSSSSQDEEVCDFSTGWHFVNLCWYYYSRKWSCYLETTPDELTDMPSIYTILTVNYNNIVVLSFLIQDIPSGISLTQVHKWLELSIQFYVSCATVHNSVYEHSDTQHNSLLDTSIIAEVLDGKGPWIALHELFYLTAKKCGWIEICNIQGRLDSQKYR